jgi:hypothetical protein
VRVACELCAAVADATARVEGGALAITCAACGGTFTAALAASPAPAAPPPTGPVCPKCEAPSAGDGPCPRCGLSPAHAAAWQAGHAEAPTASLGAAWDAVVATWSDEPSHERAAAIATETADYPWLAARYRAILRTRPDDAMARRQLERLSRRAEATLRATASAPSGDRAMAARIPFGVLLAMVFVVGVGLLYAMYVIRERNRETGGHRVERIAPSPSRR